jgi:hypothetical protein
LPSNSVDDATRIWRRDALPEWLDPELIEFDEYWGNCRIGVSEKNASADANKRPSKSSENGFPINIVLKLFRRVPLFAVALDRKLSALSLDDEVDTIRPHWPLCFHSIACREQPLKDQLFEDRIGPLTLYFHRAHQRLRIARMLNEPAPKVAGFEVCARV